MVDNSSIWKIDTKNSWALYTHTDYKPPEVKPPKESQEKKEKPQKAQVPTPFTFVKPKPLTKGGVVCTPLGYGIIQSFNEEKATITVKVEGQVYELPEKEVLNEVQINVIVINNSIKREELFYIPIYNTMSEVIEKLENSLGEGSNSYTMTLFYKGKEIERSGETVEKMKIMPNTKFLGVVKAKKPQCVKRFISHLPGWSVIANQAFAICFMPSKTIRVAGVAVYKPTQGILNAVIQYCPGSIMKSEALCSQNISVSEACDKDDMFEKVMFSKSFQLKQGEYATIKISYQSQCMIYYGNGGKYMAEGEGDVTFNFKTCDDMPFLSNIDSGQLPEIYYYV